MTFAHIELDACNTSSFPGVVANPLKTEVDYSDKLLLNVVSQRIEALEEYLRAKFGSTAVVNLNINALNPITNSAAIDIPADEEDDDALSYERLASIPHKVIPVRLVLTYRGKGKAIVQNDDIL